MYPQEDENKVDENGEGGASATSPAVSDGLPVVKGVCVDYVHANRDGASVFGRQKWMETGRYTMQLILQSSTCLPVIVYTLRRLVIRKVLSTKIWGVPPACLGRR